ncbi:UPF0175 family protein [bacterium]|nr:UPF0175 family protein [bacterium]
MTLQIELPDDLSETSPEELRLAFAAKLFGLRKVSSSKAARIAGVSRLAFLQNVGRFGVPVFDMTNEELEQEIRNADPDHG